jgi:WD40 repeat protein
VTSASLVVENPELHPAALVLVGRRDGSVALLTQGATGFVVRESVTAPVAACGSVTATALVSLPRGGLAAVCGFEDGTAMLLVASEGSAPLKQLHAWSAHRLAVRCLDVTAVHRPEGDALCIVTGSDDTTCASCWLSASSGEVLQAPRLLVQHADYVTAVSLNQSSASGSPALPAASVLTASWDGTVRRVEMVV